MDQRVARARELLEVPYLHLGRDHNGIDCVGLIAYAHDYPMELIPAYPRNPLNNELETNLTRILGKPIIDGPVTDVNDLLVGDVVAMQYAGPIRHVALVAPHPFFAEHLSLIHTDSSLGKVVEHILDRKWLRRIRKVYRS